MVLCDTGSLHIFLEGPYVMIWMQQDLLRYKNLQALEVSVTSPVTFKCCGTRHRTLKLCGTRHGTPKLCGTRHRTPKLCGTRHGTLTLSHSLWDSHTIGLVMGLPSAVGLVIGPLSAVGHIPKEATRSTRLPPNNATPDPSTCFVVMRRYLVTEVKFAVSPS